MVNICSRQAGHNDSGVAVRHTGLLIKERVEGVTANFGLKCPAVSPFSSKQMTFLLYISMARFIVVLHLIRGAGLSLLKGLDCA